MGNSRLFTSAQETAERLRRRLSPSPGVTPINSDIDVSFEFFPPSDAAAGERLWSCIERLAPLHPRFVSVTYGAGGSTRERTHETVKRILAETDLSPAAHLTCVDASRRDVDAVIEDYAAAGVKHIVALRGDPAERQSAFRPHPNGYRNAAELVAGIRRSGDFEITVAAYPEVHPDARSAQADLDNLKRKIDAGASRAITQFFFESDVYFDFLERARAAGITVPIVPGILPVTNYARVKQFAQMCGTSVPDWLGVLFQGLDEAADIRQLVAATLTAEQCTGLWERGVREFHFYTLNRPLLTLAICHILGLRPNEGLSMPVAKKSRRA
ncbi:MAG: methylenetetrahydrofolate reductase [NAD(P)H] [Gammaproteobacteria bacterium]|nr:methylenetetrahydrofolate reductase [NAD(P)H] [Gammaproteobacteria bacterium]